MKKNNRFIILILGIIFLLTSYFLKEVSFFRTIIFFLGVILIIISFVMDRNKKVLASIIYFIIIFSLAFILDYLTAVTFKKIPVLTFNNIYGVKVNIYNSFGYRIWQCDNKKEEYIIDNLYKMGYFCDSSDVLASDIDLLLPEIVNNYSKYSNTFVKLNGKVSKIVNDEFFIMTTTKKEDNIILKVYSNDLDSIKNSLSITLIGRIKSLENINNTQVITLVDASINYDNNDFDISISYKNNCKYDEEYLLDIDNYKIYYSCIDNVLIKFKNTEEYDLNYVLNNGIITVKDLLSKANNFKKSDNNNTIFIYKDFNILECNPEKSKKLIIGSTFLTNFSTYCDIISDEEVGV